MDAPHREELPGAAERASLQGRAFAEAVRGTSIIGGATAANLALTALRTKAFAILLGPEGTGVISILTALTGFIGSICGFGMSTVGAREMADATGVGGREPALRTARTVLRAALFTGVLGVLVQGILAGVISRVAFGDNAMAGAVAAVSLVLLFQGVTTGRQAYLQGTRQLRKFAWQSVLNSAAGALASVAVIAIGGEGSIPPALVTGAVATALVSYLFARIPGIRSVPLPWREFVTRARSMYRLGAFLSAGTAVTMGTGFAINALLNARFGTRGVGLYSAAWSLSGMYVGFVLAALGSDYLPRLVRVIDEEQALTVTVNEQTSVALLVGIPGILATLLLAPQILHAFYSAAFAEATAPLRWIVAGLCARLLSWPFGYLFVAAGEGAWFLTLEVIANTVHFGLVLALVGPLGLPGAGTAFAIAALVHLAIVMGLAGWKFGVRLRRGNALHGIGGAAAAGLVAALAASDRGVASQVIGAVIVAFAATLSLRELERRSGFVSLVLKRVFVTVTNPSRAKRR